MRTVAVLVRRWLIVNVAGRRVTVVARTYDAAAFTASGVSCRWLL